MKTITVSEGEAGVAEMDNRLLTTEDILNLPEGSKVYVEAAPYALTMESGWRTVETMGVVGRVLVSEKGYWVAIDGNLGHLFRVWLRRPSTDNISAQICPKDDYIPIDPEGKSVTKPLFVLKIRKGKKPDQQKLGFATKALQDAMAQGGGLILDTEVLEPLVLIYGGHVIRFDEYEEDEADGTPGGYTPPKRPEPERGTDRETW